MVGENCSASCLTRDHGSWGECVRAKGLSAQWLGGTGASYGDQRRFAAENRELRDVVRAGGSISTALNKGFDAAWSETGAG